MRWMDSHSPPQYWKTRWRTIFLLTAARSLSINTRKTNIILLHVPIVLRVLSTVCLCFCRLFHYHYPYTWSCAYVAMQTRPNGVTLPFLLHTKIDSKKTMTQKSAMKATTPGTMLCTWRVYSSHLTHSTLKKNSACELQNWNRNLLTIAINHFNVSSY